MQVNIVFRARFLCGCEKAIATIIDIPKPLATAGRTDENDKKIIEYLQSNYDLTHIHCEKKHRSKPTGLDKIIEIM